MTKLDMTWHKTGNVAAGGASAFINHQPLSALPTITLTVSLRSENIACELNVHHCVINGKECQWFKRLFQLLKKC